MDDPESSQAQLVAAVDAVLGEGPVWIGPELLWVDILASTVHLLDPERGTDRAIPVGQAVGAAVPADDGSIVLAVRDGFARLDPMTGAVSTIALVEADIPGNRMNDGACDTAGRFWAGTQSEAGERQAGRLYRLELDGTVTTVLDGVTISNGLGWSPDDRAFYYIDTASGTIDVFDHDPVTGAIEGRRVFARVPDGAGGADGLAIDTDGFVWVAFWDGWAVRRYAPDGSLDREIRMPVSHPTSCAFGGDDLRTLYVTTSRSDGRDLLPPERLESQPMAGGILRLAAPVAGLPTNVCRVRGTP